MNLLDKLKADLELAEKANSVWFLDLYRSLGQKIEKRQSLETFIEVSRTSWPATTRALIVALEALQEISSGTCKASLAYYTCHETCSPDAKEALSEIERLLFPDGNKVGASTSELGEKE